MRNISFYVAACMWLGIQGSYAAVPPGIDQAPSLPGNQVSTPTTQPKETGKTARHDIRVQIVAETSAVIGAPMSGRLQYFPLRDGERFDNASLLARFACKEQEGMLDKAHAIFSGKKAVLATSQKLKQLGTASVLDYQVASSAVAEARADVETAEAVVSHCVVTAPFAGRVSNVFVRNHQFVQLGAPLLEVLSDTALELQIILPSSWLAWVKTGTKFDIEVDETGKRYHAEVTRFSGKVDAVSQSIKVYGKILDAAPELLPGMSGSALITPPQTGTK
jgi:membrane fusion protein, multidrug efflux system